MPLVFKNQFLPGYMLRTETILKWQLLELRSIGPEPVDDGFELTAPTRSLLDAHARRLGEGGLFKAITAGRWPEIVSEAVEQIETELATYIEYAKAERGVELAELGLE